MAKHILLLIINLTCLFCLKAQEGRSTFKSVYISKIPKPTAPAILVFSNLSFSDKSGNGNNIIDANEKSEIRFSIQNKGKGKAYNVIVSLKTEQPSKNVDFLKEFRVGDIDPGHIKKIIIPISTGEYTESGISNFIITGTEANGFNPDDVSLKIETEKFINPQIKITDNIFSTETGGEAMLGFPINLKLGIQNKGQGIAKNIKVKIILPPVNVFSTGDDLIAIEELKQGEGKVIDFGFFANKKYTEKDIPVRIEITESYGKYGENKTVSVSLNQQLQQTNQVVIKGVKQESLIIPTFSLIADIDKNLPTTKMNNPDAIAVVIGNSSYYKTKSVDFATNDARSIKNYLINVLGFKEGNILYKENATLGDFSMLFGTKESTRGKLANTIKEGISDVFIFYAGHGAPGLKDNKGYFVPVECDPNYVENSGYQLDIFYQNLAQLKAKSVTVILDACFSGANVFEKISPIVIRIKDPVLLINNAVVITSSSGTEVSTWYDEKEHGMFTYFFLRAIQDREKSDSNNDGNLSYQEIFDYINNKNEGVPYYARRIHGIEQNPTILGDNKNNILMKY